MKSASSSDTSTDGDELDRSDLIDQGPTRDGKRTITFHILQARYAMKGKETDYVKIVAALISLESKLKRASTVKRSSQLIKVAWCENVLSGAKDNHYAKFRELQQQPSLHSLTDLCSMAVIDQLYQVRRTSDLSKPSIDCTRLPPHLRERLVRIAFRLYR
ncbi:hypothetical protein MRB53_039324 [Persea americana]|nr:hypothetical protein MRB53_039324 [Persea americana]